MKILTLDNLNSKIVPSPCEIRRIKTLQSKLINKMSFNPLFRPVDELKYKIDTSTYQENLNGLKTLKLNIPIKVKINKEKLGLLKNNS